MQRKTAVVPPLFPDVVGDGSRSGSRDPSIRWKRGEMIGQGAFGTVFLGLNTDNGELMAVKQMSLEEVSSKELRSLENEINLLRSLRHPNIVRYIGTETTPTSLSIFLEYIPGGSLKSLIEKFGMLGESVARSYTRQLLLGLEYLHRNGIAHRDIKGANCLVCNDGVVKLADFGASKAWRPSTALGTSSQNRHSCDIKGTPSWMAPELIKDQEGVPISWRKADVWSIACTTLEMTTGQPPWSQFNNPVTVLYHIACTEALPDYPATASPELVTFLNICLQREPCLRPDLTSLLMHPFVSGASWSSVTVRPSTVSTTPAWAWESPSARGNGGSTPLVPLITSRPFSLEAVMLPPDKRRSLSVVSLTTVPDIVSDDHLSDNESCSTTTSTITAASSVQVKRRVRRTRVALGVKGKQRRSESKKDEKVSSTILYSANEPELHQESRDILFTEEDGDDEEEILEEIEESFEDSVEVLQLSALDGNGNKLLDCNTDEKNEIENQELSLEFSGLEIGGSKQQEENTTELWKADSKAVAERRGSASRISSKPALKPQGSLRERRQWSGQNIDTLGTNADSSSALAVIGRESPQGLGICAVKQQQKYAVHSSSKRSTPNAASTPSLSSSKLERQRSGQSVSDAALEVGARCESRPRSVISTAYSFDDLEESRGEGVGDASGRGEKSRFGRLDMQTLSEHEGAVNKLWTSRESNLLLSASNDGTIRIWGGRGTCSRAVLDTGHFSTAGASEEQIRGRTVRQEDAKRDSSTLKVNHLWAEEGLDSIWGGCSDYNLRVWNGGEGRALRFIKGHDDIITCMDGGCLVGGIQSLALVATGSADKTVRVFDVRSKKPQVFIFRGHTDAVLAVKMGDGGRTLLTGGKDKSIRIFDLRAGRLRVSLDKHFGAVSAFRLIADMQLGKSGEGSGFVSGGRDSMINVWTMAGDHVATQAAHRNFLSRFSTSANEDLSCPHFLTTGADATVKIWDARRIRQVGEVKTGPVTDVVYHSGRSFATTSPTGLVRQWATATTGSAGEPLSSRSSSAASTREWTATDLAQHSSACTDLVSSASLLASASKSGQICRWSSSS